MQIINSMYFIFPFNINKKGDLNIIIERKPRKATSQYGQSKEQT